MMFIAGIVVGMVIAIIASVGFAFFACHRVYGDWATFEATCDVIGEASCNRASELRVYHDGECLATAYFDEEELD